MVGLMIRFGCKFVLMWALLICLIGLTNQSATGTVISLPSSQTWNLTGTNYNIYMLVLSYFNSQEDDSLPSGNLLSITNGGENVPFFSLAPPAPVTNNGIVYSPIGFYRFTAKLPGCLSETYTLTWTNYSADVTVDFYPFFLVQPQGQSVFVGSDVVFNAQAFHTTGYQWQRDGTNLVEDGHFIGVTNSTLTISNAQIEDAGDYTVIANHPANPTTSFDAILGVFKPIQLGLTQSPSDGSCQLQVGNQDGSPVNNSGVSHFTIYSTTDLSLSVSNWDVESATGVLTNGIYLIHFPDGGSPPNSGKWGNSPNFLCFIRAGSVASLMPLENCRRHFPRATPFHRLRGRSFWDKG